MSSPTLKEELHSLIEQLSDEEAEQILDYINMRETVTLDELMRELGE